MKNITEETASKYLGKKVEGSVTYDPTLLVSVPRKENRTHYNIKNDNLPFVGWDIWHAYEFSALTQNGLPVTRLIKIKYNCNNEFLIESKSLKLYLNSLNMSRFGKTIAECLKICKDLIQTDLKEKLQTEVLINYIDNNAKRSEIFNSYINLMTLVNEKNLKIEQYKESPGILKVEETKTLTEYRLMFDSLRSNCRVTHQPDFGDVFIYYKSQKHIVEESLVKYLTSFRSEFHFHEECCEMIFKRLSDILDKNTELMVSTLYTRRGGIDICSVRWSRNCKIDDVEQLIETSEFARNGVKQ